MSDILDTIDSAQRNGSMNDRSKFMDLGPSVEAAKWIQSNDSASSIDFIKIRQRGKNRSTNTGSISSWECPSIIRRQSLYFCTAEVKNWTYFEKKYAIALKPDEDVNRPRYLELMINGQKAADVELISAPTGQNLMTMMEQDNLDMAIVGITPAIGSISLGCKAKIIQPLQNEGSGLVMATASEADDWNGFVPWLKPPLPKAVR